MNADDLSQFYLIGVTGFDRWQIYFRLQELEIPCCCKSHQPLQVQVKDVVAAVQIWSVCSRATMHRQGLVQWLDRCWQK